MPNIGLEIIPAGDLRDTCPNAPRTLAPWELV
jgi:hypothetical protein